MHSWDSHGQGSHIQPFRLVTRQRHQGYEEVGVTFSSHTLCPIKDGHIIFVTRTKQANVGAPNHPQASEIQDLTIKYEAE